MNLQEEIKQKIQQGGPITVAEYMAIAMQHPQAGYYRKAQAVGAEGDFITAPECSQIFGDLLGMWVIGSWQAIGQPSSLALVELGPGRGTLMSDMSRMIAKVPELKSAVTVHLVESNTTLRQQQKEKLWQMQPQWHDTIDTLPSDQPLCIIANEFLDALPIAQWVGDIERQVGLAEDGSFCFLPEGAVTEEKCPMGLEIMQQLSQRLKRQGGVMLWIDYGYVRKDAEDKDTLQALKDHQFHNPLENAGDADLTAHVDFLAMKAQAEAEGVTAYGPTEQGAFLQRLGGDIWLQKLLMKADKEQQKEIESGWMRLISPTQMGSLFKVMAMSAEPAAIAGFE